MESILPIPTDLKNMLITKGEENDEFFVAGYIACTCGNKEFSLSYLGAYENEIVTFKLKKKTDIKKYYERIIEICKISL